MSALKSGRPGGNVRGKRVVVGAALALLILVLVVTVPFPAGSVVSVADRFNPDSPITSNTTVEPRRVLCLGGNPCPSVSRSWKFDHAVSTEQLSEWLNEAEYIGEIEGDCEEGPGLRDPICSFRGEASGYSVQLFLETDASKMTSSLTLFVR